MLLLKPKPLPYFIGLFSLGFVALALMLSDVLWQVKVIIFVLVSATVLMHYWYQQKQFLPTLKYLPEAKVWFLFHQDNVMYSAKLLPNSYVGRYFLILNFQPMQQGESAALRGGVVTSLLFRWHFDRSTWRQIRAELFSL